MSTENWTPDEILDAMGPPRTPQAPPETEHDKATKALARYIQIKTKVIPSFEEESPERSIARDEMQGLRRDIAQFLGIPYGIKR